MLVASSSVSDSCMRILPTDPSFVPDPVVEARFMQAVERVVPQAEGVEVIEVPEIEFVDAGGNWSGVRCPHCLADLAAFENGQWWGNRMDESYKATHFADRRVDLPCCGTTSDLANLDYLWNSGFAKWWVDCFNPGRAELTADEVERLSEQLGHAVHVVYQRI
jgi:hypothetical protein